MNLLNYSVVIPFGIFSIIVMAAVCIFSFVTLICVKKRNDDPAKKVKLRKRITVLTILMIASGLFYTFGAFSFDYLGFWGLLIAVFDVISCINLLIIKSQQPNPQAQPQPQAQSRPQAQPQSQTAQPQPQPQVQSRFCPHCGAELQEESFFCEHCGNKL